MIKKKSNLFVTTDLVAAIVMAIIICSLFFAGYVYDLLSIMIVYLLLCINFKITRIAFIWVKESKDGKVKKDSK